MADPVTIYSVAERAGVSIATVSRVLRGSAVVSERSRARVEEAMAELRYVPTSAARSLAVRHQEAHGLVLPELSGPYYSELLMGFEERAAALGQSVSLVLLSASRDVGTSLNRLASRVDGLAYLSHPWLTSADVMAAAGDKPVVVIAGSPAECHRSHDAVDIVTTENHDAAAELVRHLLDHGYAQLEFIGDPAAAADVAERHRGFMTAHRERGLEPMPPVPVGFREEDGVGYAEQVLKRRASGEHIPDALVCANDELALAAMAKLQAEGVDIPHELAITGWDDVMTSRYVTPGLTTVAQPVRELGALAADRLKDHLNQTVTQAGHAQVLSSTVIFRGSCGCPPTPANA